MEGAQPHPPADSEIEPIRIEIILSTRFILPLPQDSQAMACFESSLLTEVKNSDTFPQSAHLYSSIAIMNLRALIVSPPALSYQERG